MIMKRPGRILIVEDSPQWQDVLVRTLTRDGFEVESASTVDDALRAFATSFYHLAIFDIRLTEMDESSIEGMELLRILDELDLLAATEIIMNTAYGTKQQMRAAFREYRVADFLTKDDFNSRRFLSTVRQVFTEHVGVNLDLDIVWQIPGNAEHCVTDMEINGSRLKPNSPMSIRVASEMDDLLCRLFHTAKKITVWSSTPEPSQTGLLWVQPDNKSGAGQPVVVKFGYYSNIEDEFQNNKHVEPFIGSARHSEITHHRRTPLLGGIIYSLVGAVSSHLVTFGEFYRSADISQIKNVLDSLFLGTFAAWYAKRTALEAQELGNIYEQSLQLGAEGLTSMAHQRLQDVEIGKGLRFKALTTTKDFRNPFDVVGERRFLRQTRCCTTHGNLNANNFLIDTDGQAFLVDFSKTGPGHSHILRDVAALDSSVRLQLLESDEATLDERMALEEALCQITHFSQIEENRSTFVAENPAIAKTYHVVTHLRSLAHRLLSPNPSQDISELYIALFYHALYTMRLPQLSKTQIEHAVLSASLLLEAIDRIYEPRVVELELELLEIDQLSKKRFEYLSTASHELGRPLALIKARLEDLLDQELGFLSARQKGELTSALDEVNHEIGLINRMLDLTRLEAGKVRIEPISCNVVDCLREAISESLEDLRKKGIILRQDLPSPGIEIMADPLYLRRAYSNVIHNAIKFTEEGEIGVSCKSDGTEVVVKIEDTGSGIDPNVLSHIFEPYFQVDRSPARKYSGLGAGLYLVKSWIELHGGSVHVESVVNQGSAFYIRVPIRIYTGSDESEEVR